jgi:NAD(P)-dependent dehydrogenase (short-subunit alcohol dehydrogenase family)
MESQKQHAIGTGFSAANTAEDVLKGINLTGKNVIITGGHSGIGLEVTKSLSKAGANIIIAVRNTELAAAKVTGIKNVELSQLDLSSPESIAAFADRYLESGRPLHILLNNAGVMGGPLVRDKRGYESNFSTNYLGHFQLTLGLLPALQKANSARIVNTTSGAFRLSDIRWDDINFENGDYDPHMAYAQSKTANVLHAVEIDKLWNQYHINSYAVHPGIIMGTNLGGVRNPGEEKKSIMTTQQKQAAGLIDADGNPVINPEAGLKTAEQGASTIVLAATSPMLNEISGVYLRNNEVSPIDSITPVRPGFTNFDIVPYAIDSNSAQRLWELSESLLK